LLVYFCLKINRWPGEDVYISTPIYQKFWALAINEAGIIENNETLV